MTVHRWEVVEGEHVQQCFYKLDVDTMEAVSSWQVAVERADPPELAAMNLHLPEDPYRSLAHLEAVSFHQEGCHQQLPTQIVKKISKSVKMELQKHPRAPMPAKVVHN